MYARYRDIRELKPQLEKTLARCKELMTENDQLKHENEIMKGAQENTDSLQVFLHDSPNNPFKFISIRGPNFFMVLTWSKQ